MTILEAIQTANAKAGVTNFNFADISEFNAYMDSFNHLDYPAHVVSPFSTSVNWLNGRTKTTVTIQGWFLKRLSSDTTNFRSIKVEEIYLQPMREKCKLFLKHLMQDDDVFVVDPEVDSIICNIKPEYALLPARVFGVSYTLTLPVVESIC